MAAKKSNSRKRKKVEELSTDEFLQFGLDSDASEEDTAVEDSPPPHKKSPVETKSSTHKSQLDGLKDKDPEFYKFLLENDEKLLEFDESDVSEEESDKEEEEDDNDEVQTTSSKKPAKKKMEPDNEDVESNEDSRVPLTADMINAWTTQLKDKPTIKVIRQVMSGFHCAVIDISAQTDDKVDTKQTLPYQVGSQAFNSVTRICLQLVHPTLTQLLKTDKLKRAKGRQQLPSSSKDWSKVKTGVKAYLYDLLQLMRQLVDAEMLTVVLKHAKQMSSFYACFPRIAKMYLKRLVRMWSSNEELPRVMALLCARQMTLLLPNLFEFVVKLMYISYVKNCKFVNAKSQSMVVFMRNSLVEILALDVNAAYQIGFVYIRQLAIHLRNAFVKKKDSHQAVYNWQYIACIQLWCHVLGSLHSDIMKPLIYPVVQITLGVIRVIPSARYYPLRFHCLRSLIALAKATGTYIPISPYLTEVLETNEFTKMPKPSTSKPSDFAVALKVPKSELHSKAFLEAVINSIYDLLLEHFVNMSSSIGFPELVYPTSRRLKRFVKRAKVQKFSKQMKQLNDKLQETASEIISRRSTVDFSPKDLDEVDKWENEMSVKGNKLMTFHASWKKTQDAIALQQQQQDEDSDDDVIDSDKEETKKKEPSKKKKKSPKETPQKQKPKRQKAATPAQAQRTGHAAMSSVDDSVQDLVLSDSD